MARNSALTPFIAHGIQKMLERGIRDCYSKQHLISEPNCKPLREEGQPLGMEKIAPLFVFYLVGCTMSGIILILENIFKPSSSSSSSSYTKRLQEHLKKLEILKEELEKLSIDYEENVSKVGEMKPIAIETEIRITLDLNY